MSRMAWRKPPAHTLVPAKEVRRLTGLGPSEVLLQRDTQRLVRIDENGTRQEFIRIPIELLLTEPE